MLRKGLEITLLAATVLGSAIAQPDINIECTYYNAARSGQTIQ